MTLANWITLVRIFLIPVFAFLANHYGMSVVEESPREWRRLIASGIFLLACATDALDGWAARRLGGHTRLGSILDPIADKGLLLTAILTLNFSRWPMALPLWFTLLVIAHDLVLLLGCSLLFYTTGRVDIRPSSLGKISTAFQMLAVGWTMLQFPLFCYPVWIAGVCTFVSGTDYVYRGTLLLGSAYKGLERKG
ncbi:MAG: CDP-alcohol phosphatidyltransferase family protein [Candidatus Xiphinematobacter sp.]|nr:MAG: CDP-alcohol phosphatidyltransferase family protein [Candidatus Xiphinematobacter sp.]QQY11478.1 MAG: CDP-alcohol phosphatidyltransferase family protein [Candidatus Xiphinematobacter sp.]